MTLTGVSLKSLPDLPLLRRLSEILSIGKHPVGVNARCSQWYHSRPASPAQRPSSPPPLSMAPTSGSP